MLHRRHHNILCSAPRFPQFILRASDLRISQEQVLDGWDSHFVGPDGDDGGAGVADSAALLAAKRQGAHGGCMIQQIFVLGMCAMAAVVNEM